MVRVPVSYLLGYGKRTGKFTWWALEYMIACIVFKYFNGLHIVFGLGRPNVESPIKVQHRTPRIEHNANHLILPWIENWQAIQIHNVASNEMAVSCTVARIVQWHVLRIDRLFLFNVRLPKHNILFLKFPKHKILSLYMFPSTHSTTASHHNKYNKGKHCRYVLLSKRTFSSAGRSFVTAFSGNVFVSRWGYRQ